MAQWEWVIIGPRVFDNGPFFIAEPSLKHMAYPSHNMHLLQVPEV